MAAAARLLIGSLPTSRRSISTSSSLTSLASARTVADDDFKVLEDVELTTFRACNRHRTTSRRSSSVSSSSSSSSSSTSSTSSPSSPAQGIDVDTRQRLADEIWREFW
ncbi:hypothetical protein GQ602_000516 [Ophiocordyceps camponoti-floridani]|uniref:Uncharacterized protein n=1 Tax=Ophiocordyceps camponoti-floridani TaxID=2030778 RepID=A0A8H4QCB9_9HYPO|nr:hypothetical protein GQ602_000516 [Ophiocordyceps camponoti-floridani]